MLGNVASRVIFTNNSGCEINILNNSITSVEYISSENTKLRQIKIYGCTVLSGIFPLGICPDHLTRITWISISSQPLQKV